MRLYNHILPIPISYYLSPHKWFSTWCFVENIVRVCLPKPKIKMPLSLQAAWDENVQEENKIGVLLISWLLMSCHVMHIFLVTVAFIITFSSIILFIIFIAIHAAETTTNYSSPAGHIYRSSLNMANLSHYLWQILMVSFNIVLLFTPSGVADCFVPLSSFVSCVRYRGACICIPAKFAINPPRRTAGVNQGKSGECYDTIKKAYSLFQQ